MATTICLLLLLSGYIRGEEYIHHPVQYQSITDRGTYNFGYDTGLFGAHSLRREQKDEDGIVRGKYAYTDPNGKLRTVVYEAGPFGFRAKGDVGPDGYPQSQFPEQSNLGSVPITDTGIPSPETLQGEGTHHIEYNLRPPVAGSDQYVQAASSHPNRESKGYVYDPASHPSVEDRVYVPQASSHPNRETKGYTYDPATHPDVRDRIYVPDSSFPRQKVKPPVPSIPDPPVRIPDASSHPNRETKGYTYDPATHPDVRNRIYVPQPSHPRQNLKPPVPPPSPPSPPPPPPRVNPPVIRVPAASSHPNRETKGYTYDPATHPNVQGRIYVPDSSRHQTHVHVSPSHPNHHTKAYVHDSSSHSHVHVPQHPAPPAKPSHPNVVIHPAPPPRSSSYSKEYTPARSEIIAVSRASSVSVVRSPERPVYTKGYVTGSRRAQASTNRQVYRPSAQASVSRPVSRPTYTKGYVTGSGSSRSVSRTSSATGRIPHTHQHDSHDHMKSSGSARSVKITGFRQSSYVPKYMSAEEYLKRYRGGKDSRPQS